MECPTSQAQHGGAAQLGIRRECAIGMPDSEDAVAEGVRDELEGVKEASNCQQDLC